MPPGSAVAAFAAQAGVVFNVSALVSAVYVAYYLLLDLKVGLLHLFAFLRLTQSVTTI